MPIRRGRKGKQGSAAKQAAISAANAAVPPLQPPPVGVMESTATTLSRPQVTSTSTPQQQTSSNSSAMICTNIDNDDVNRHHQLILTSDKRRGVYECDYCGCDVSQTPRIRCAICVDFDVCCDCFITTDPMTAIARLQTAHHAMALQQQQQSSDWDGGGSSSSSSSTTMISSSTPQHDPLTHGYRVCDSTRYPLFPTNAAVVACTAASMNPPNATSNISNNTGTKASTNKNKIQITERGTTDKDEVSLEPPINDKNKMEGVETDMKADSQEITTSTVDSTMKEATTTTTATIEPIVMSAGDDQKTIWTIEEDLRLLCGIQTHGLGNWTEISEAIVGHGSSGKTPKRCMERYFDDYMGRYGCILPPYTLIGEANTTTTTNNNSNHPDTDDDMEIAVDGDSSKDPNKDVHNNSTTATPTASTPGTATTTTNEVAVRSSKRRSTMLRTPGGGTSTLPVTKKYLAVPTESLPEYQYIQWKPFLPKLDSGSVVVGQEVGRDQATKAELAYVRTISGLDSQEQVERIRKDWERNRLNQPGGPTVLPMRPDDVPKLPGSEVAGYMPRRGDFDIEYENNAEEAIADMEFVPGESEQDRNLKLAVLAIYHSKLVERNKRKQFIISRKLYNYKSYQDEYRKLPRDERDLVLRMRLFERFHTPEEHKIFIADILKAKRLRKEIAKLQMYRRIGIRTQLEAERYEIDKARRLFHKNAVTQHNDEMAKTESSTVASDTGAATAAGMTSGSTHMKVASSSLGSDVHQESASSSSSQYWKQYRTTDRKVRRSVNRGISDDSNTKVDATMEKLQDGLVMDSTSQQQESTPKNIEAEEPTKDVVASNDSMEVDETTTNKDSSIAQRECADGDEPMGSTIPPADEANDTTTLDAANDDDDVARLPGYHQLSSREIDLIRSIQISPQQYIEIKKALIYESLQYGLLNTNDNSNDNQKEDETSDARRIRRTTSTGTDSYNLGNTTNDSSTHHNHTLFVLDVERRGTIIDFVLQAGWITTQYGKSVLS
jgi:hypothetical protein